VLSVAAEPVPIEVEETGTARLGGTRLTLDVVIGDVRRYGGEDWELEPTPGL